MRLNKLLTVALASMMMFSCSNNDEVDNGLSNGEKKAVILRLDGGFDTEDTVDGCKYGIRR